MKNDSEKILIFLKVNSTRTWPCSYVFPFKMKNRGSHSSRWKKNYCKRCDFGKWIQQGL